MSILEPVEKLLVVVECEFSVLLLFKPFPSGLTFVIGPSQTILHFCNHGGHFSDGRGQCRHDKSSNTGSPVNRNVYELWKV